MLKEVTIQNYKSINQEVLFSMEADTERVSEYKYHILDINGNKLLKVASMYGPNGGGKTNILEALFLLKTIIFYNNQPSTDALSNVSCNFSNSNDISETVFFVTPNYEIGYKFIVSQTVSEQYMMDLNGNKKTILVNSFNFSYESVIFRKNNEEEFVVLFERDLKGNINSPIFDSLSINYSKVINGSLSAVSYFYNTFVNVLNLNDSSFEVISNLYKEISNIEVLEVKNVNVNVALKVIETNKKKLINLLNDVDIKISDIVINKDNRYAPIRFEREILIDGKKEKRQISFKDESNGTKKIFWMFVNLLNENTNNRIFLCDDMNAYLHPKLFKSIVEIFNSSSNVNKQLIFNSHDIINMTNELFRRDEIWFVYRDENYSTKLVPLSNIVNYKGEQVRKDAKYYKQYLEGKYGADPFIKKGLSWND